MERDDVLVKIRPHVDFESGRSNEMEDFQNNTLRPILKFQNRMLISWFRNYLKRRVPLFNAYKGSEQKKTIKDIMLKDQEVKNNLIPSIVGLFTLEEFEFYNQHKKECNKRLTSLLTKRFQDQVESLIIS